jgi:threonine dehydrogenase-like Zn-dependent dehydrogenase
MNISVVGTGYVGLVVGACLAETGNQVVGADIDERKIAGLKQKLNTAVVAPIPTARIEITAIGKLGLDLKLRIAYRTSCKPGTSGSPHKIRHRPIAESSRLETLPYQHREATQHDIAAVRRHVADARLRHLHRKYGE